MSKIKKKNPEEQSTTLENFGEQKLKKTFEDSGNPFTIKVGELIDKKASIKDIVNAAKMAAEQRFIESENNGK